MATFHHRIKSGRKGTARNQAGYIDRRGKYSNRVDLVHRGCGNLPAWSNGDPFVFWRGADRHERSNGAAYREHEIALPVELSREHLVSLVERIVSEVVPDRPYQYAIHVPEDKLEGTPNPHVHIMYSDRIPDGIERTEKQSFARYNRKKPELGGCRKDSGGKTSIELRDDVIATRKKIATLQNEALAAHGHDGRVDHRSLKDRGSSRAPEPRLGPAGVRQLSDTQRKAWLSARVSISENHMPVPGTA